MKLSAPAVLAGLRRNAAEMRMEAGHLAGRRYPAFVTTRRPEPTGQDLPVFVLHTIEPNDLEAQLRHLVDNGYRTIGCQAFLEHLTGMRPAPPNSVLLTIDDGRTSVWTFGYPLLKKYGMMAVVFLIPGYVPETEEKAPTLEEVWAGRVPAGQLPRRDPELMSWQEIRTAVEDGVIEVGSHTLYHHPVPVSDKIVGYVGPGENRAVFDLPIEPGREAQLRRDGVASLYGAPIYESAPLMSGRALYLPDPEISSACIEHAARSGGADFFRSDGWRRELDAVVKRSSGRSRGRMADGAERRAVLAQDLRRSRELIEERLGRSVRHLCYPYTAGSELAVEVSRDEGYLTNFWGVLAARRSNRPGDDPYHCPRLKADYIFRLPGRKRRSLPIILANKAIRRISGRPVY